MFREGTVKPHIYTVSELTKNIKSILEDAFPHFWLEGEVSNFTHHASGHMYFSLKDKSALIWVCMFRGANEKLKFKLSNGMQVICFGRVSVYEKRGQYQIIAQKIEPKGIGGLQLAFEQLKEKLSVEGLFSPEHKKPLPLFPFRVGIVTSASGAAVRDIIEILKREAGLSEIILRPAIVQGEEAAGDIVCAIEEFNRYKEVDLLIVGRGGGSLEDLWAFNEEKVARAIYNSQIPIISAVGHEIDFTISDLVADLRAETPSAAAKIIVHKKLEVQKRIDEFSSRMRNIIEAVAQEKTLEIDDLLSSASLSLRHMIQVTELRFSSLLSHLEAVSPLGVLSRGFSLTTMIKGEIIRDARFLKEKDIVNTRLNKGSFQSEVIKIKRDIP